MLRFFNKTYKKTGAKIEKMQKNSKIREKFFKRVWTKAFLCGKLWETL